LEHLRIVSVVSVFCECDRRVANGRCGVVSKLDHGAMSGNSVPDDLADVESDRLIHPGRVLCQTKSHKIFWGILGLLLIVNAVLIAAFKSYHFLGVFLALNVSYLIWYSIPRKVTNDSVVSRSFVLAKYPVFVFLLSGSHSDARAGLPLGYGMLITFLCFCAYELQHDQRLRANRHATSLLACEFSALLFVAILMLIDLRRNASILAFVQAGLLAAGSIILAYLFQQYRVRAAPGWWHFGVFFVAFAWLLNFALGSDGPFDPLRGDSPATSHDKTRFPKGTDI
jgi:hypothetical protein